MGAPFHHAPIHHAAHHAPIHHAPIVHHAPVPAPTYKPAPVPVPAPVYAPAPAPYVEPAKEPAQPYAVQYGVADEYSGSKFSASETSDGKAVTGSYSVALPDGRIQTVTYTADHYNG